MVCQQANTEMDEEDTIRLKVAMYRFKNLEDLQTLRQGPEDVLRHLSRIKVDWAKSGFFRFLVDNMPFDDDEQGLMVLSRLPKLRQLQLHVGFVEPARGGQDYNWMLLSENIRDEHYQLVMQNVLNVLPSLNRGLRLEVSFKLRLSAHATGQNFVGMVFFPITTRVEVNITLVYECRGAAGWKEVGVTEEHEAYLAFGKNFRRTSKRRHKKDRLLQYPAQRLERWK